MYKSNLPYSTQEELMRWMVEVYYYNYNLLKASSAWKRGFMKKAFDVTKKILVGLLFAFAVFMMIFTIVSVTTFDRNDRDIFGYKIYTDGCN